MGRGTARPGRELLGAIDADRGLAFDPEAVGLDDEGVLELLEPAVREWWVREFGEFVPQNGGFFTPPQKEAIPLIHGRENALICAPTGSGKCIRPETPLVVETDGRAQVLRAEELKHHRGQKLADVDREGMLFDSDIEAYSFRERDGSLVNRSSMVYTEPYEGDLRRIETEYGRSVEVTPDHPLLVETREGMEWRRAEEIDEGDKVGVPREIDLPERSIELNVDRAVEVLRDRFSIVLTSEEGGEIAAALRRATSLSDLSESERQQALALTGESVPAIADDLDVGASTVYDLLAGEMEYEADALLDLFESRLNPPAENEVVVKTDGGTISRFTYPETLSPDVARIAAFVLAEGFVGDYETSGTISISQSLRTDLLETVLNDVRSAFDTSFVPKGEGDYVISDSAFAAFFAELLGIQPDPGRQVEFPQWVLNAKPAVKRTFLSTFLSTEAEVRENEVRVVQANEMKIEQLNYLLLSFGILPSRTTKTSVATNTEPRNERKYYELTVRGKSDLQKLLSEVDLRHPRAEALKAYADGGTVAGNHVGKYAFDFENIRALSSYYEDDEEFDDRLGSVSEVVRRTGYITSQAIERLESELRRLPDEDPVTDLLETVTTIRSRNVAWLTVTDVRRVPYEGEIIDLSVPDTHNFVGGRGAMYLHNTLASFTAIIDELYRRDREAGLENSVYCLYVSPLRSLANDIHRNLTVPLEGISKIAAERGDETGNGGDDGIDVRHAIRHGDTDDGERRRMLDETPHILNTTPETLAILLNSPKFKEKLRTVEYVVVDEIHSLADNKRGTHLAVSLERLEALCAGSPTRIGCSATVEPLSTMAEFLVGREPVDGDGPPADDASGESGGSETGTGTRTEAEIETESGDGAGTGSDARSSEMAPRDYEIVDTRFVREFDLELSCPTDDLINTPRDVVTDRFYEQLHDLVAEHTNTLVFTNTRSGAERVLHNLRERYDYDEANSGCHHGSLSKDRRQAVEEGLKRGDLDVVTTSTSLELGIDMPHVDLVVQVGSPKSVAALLQRVGRAGHSLGETVTGRVVALDRDELVECAVMLQRAEEGFVDRVFVPENAQDVAAQHVYGMAINGVRPEWEIRRTLERAYPYRNYGDDEWASLVRYLTADYEGMEEKNVYPKVWRDANDPPGGEHHHEDHPVGETLMGKRGRLARVIYMTNIGTIPDSFACDVVTRGGDEWVGQLDEEYLDTLDAGDVFVLGGSNYEYRYRRGSKVYVEPTAARPTVPSWFSERLPLSYDLGREILAFQRELLDRLDGGGPPAVRRWLRSFPLDENSVRATARMYDQQVRYAGPESVSTDERLAIEVELDREEYRRRYYVHSNYGRRFNDGLSRLLAYRCAQTTNANVQVAVADHGFTLSMPLNRKVDLAGVVRGIDPVEVRSDLRASLDGTDLLKRYFRINAARALMILKRYKGYEKSAAQQQVSSEMLLGFAESLPEFAVLEETYREIMEDKLHVAGVEAVLAAVDRGEVAVRRRRVDSPTPRAFGLATLAASDVVLADDESEVLREFHGRVLREIGEGRAIDPPD